jgi:DNA-directed RNA polymerase subunit M/transcription elongation factor TFIIS
MNQNKDILYYHITMHTIKNPTNFRSNICVKLCDIIGDEMISINLEKGVFNYAIKEGTSKKIIKKWDNSRFVQLYLDRLRSVYINLKNVELLDQIKTGEITPQTLAFMTHQEMNQTRWKELIEQKIKRDINKYETKIQASTDMFTCRKCKSKRCTYYELQTRSADEPATIFITCLDCGKNWKS